MRIGADVPDPEKGELVKDAFALFSIVHGEDVEEITHAEFQKWVEKAMSRSKI